ncbi:MAG: citrate synthase, partial [Bacteroidia bacterium]|nr:citrate synthase [Bacteroidia bacterium]
MQNDYMIFKLSETIKTTSRIDKELFTKFGVKRGLRNEDHSGVLVGLSKIGDVVGYEKDAEGKINAIPGKLIYRGIDVVDLALGIQAEDRLGFEETAYLLLSGYLPDAEELKTFHQILYNYMPLEQKATMNILDLEGSNIMNILSRSVLEMYTFDPNPDSITRENLMRQSLELIAKFPTIIAYAYNIYRHSQQGRSLHIRHPNEGMSIAENFLFMMKGPNNYTQLTVRVTSCSHTDTYSSIAAGIGSLKGPLHGGANIEVNAMFDHLKVAIKDWKNVKEIDAYLTKMLNKDAYNKSGLIYGIGHAVYTVSDPRAVVLKDMAREMAKEKGLEKELAFMELVEDRAVKAFM